MGMQRQADRVKDHEMEKRKAFIARKRVVEREKRRKA